MKLSFCTWLPCPRLTGVSTCRAVLKLILSSFFADELLQEQKADMDQFLSSISESQPDVTVSSEESVEIPVSEGKPYRPFQVTSLGSRSEPEGEQHQLTHSHTQHHGQHCGCEENNRPYTQVFLRDSGEPELLHSEREQIDCVFYAVANVLWGHGFGLICACTVSCGLPCLQHSTTEVQINAKSLRLWFWAGAKSLREKKWAVMVFFIVTFVPNKRLNLQREKTWWMEHFQQDGRQITSKSPRNISHICQHPQRA